jgi:hypothetical protein
MYAVTIHLKTFFLTKIIRIKPISITILSDIPICVQLLALLNGEELYNHALNNFQ